MVNQVDGLGAKLNPLALDENSGADLERQIGVELQHDRGHSSDRGSTKRPPAAILDSEVEKHTACRETTLRDKRAVEQGLVIDPLNLSGNEPMWIFRRGWYRSRGEAGSLSFGWS